MTKLRSITLFIALSLLLSSCSLHVMTTINSDGSGEERMEMGITASDMKLFEKQAIEDGSTAEEFQRELDEDFCNPEDVKDDHPEATAYIEKRGTETWCITIVPFNSLEDLHKRSEGGFAISTYNRLEIIDDRLYYDTDVDLSSASVDEFEGIEVDFIWKLTMPGEISDHNADNVRGRTLIWNLTPGEKINMYAESSTIPSGIGDVFNGESFPWVPVALACLCCSGVIVLILGVVIFIVMRKRKEQAI